MTDRVEELNSRARLYRQFGSLLYREADPDWLRLFLSEIRPTWEELGCEFDDDLDVGIEQLKEALDAEFTTLWYAPGGVPIYESIFETGMLFQAPCDQVQEVYRRVGFEFTPDEHGRGFADHAGVELEFLGRVLEKEAEAILSGEKEEAERLHAVFVDFLREHAGRWIPAMLNYSLQAAEHSFYRELSKLALGFLCSEIESELPRREHERLLAMIEREPKELDYDADFRKASGL